MEGARKEQLRGETKARDRSKQQIFIKKTLSVVEVHQKSY